MALLQTCLLFLSFIFVVNGFVSSPKTSKFSRSGIVVEMNAKTPLVGNEIRFEATPGSPLIPAIAKLGMKVPVSKAVSLFYGDAMNACAVSHLEAPARLFCMSHCEVYLMVL